MSETKCKCGVSRQRHWKSVGLPLRLFCSGVQGEMREFEPAEPVIEVAPGEPTCEYCGPECYGGAAHNIRVEDGARYTDDPVPAVPELRLPDSFGSMGPSQAVKDWGERFEALAHTAVPAQEAPREPICEHCSRPIVGLQRCSNDGWCKAIPTAEPQAGAQVPSQDEHELAQRLIRASKGWMQERIAELEAHLNTIRNYATEAAKTPITREDMHDPLKAQTFYDEAKGFERLVMSEIGGSK